MRKSTALFIAAALVVAMWIAFSGAALADAADPSGSGGVDPVGPDGADPSSCSSSGGAQDQGGIPTRNGTLPPPTNGLRDLLQHGYLTLRCFPDPNFSPDCPN